MQLRQLGTRVPLSMYLKIKAYCAINDISVQEFVIGSLKKEMQERGIK